MGGWTYREKWLLCILLAIVGIGLTGASITEPTTLGILTLNGAFRAKSTARFDGATTLYGNVDFGDDAADVATFHRAVVTDTVYHDGNVTLNDGKYLRYEYMICTKATSARPDTTGLPDGVEFTTPGGDSTLTYNRPTGTWSAVVGS